MVAAAGPTTDWPTTDWPTTNADAAAVAATSTQLRRARAVVVSRTLAYAFVVAMLGFGLLPIISAVVYGQPRWSIAVGSVAFVVIASAFMQLVTEAMRQPWQNRAWRQATVVTVVTLVLPVTVHVEWQVIGFLGIAALAVTLRPRYGLIGAFAVSSTMTAERLLLGVPQVTALTVQDVLTGAALAAIIVLVAFIEELFTAPAEVAQLAVTAERIRFARDLHDTLGHSLSAIALKSELATRLIDADVERARAELIDVHAIARESLSTVRTVATGYRQDSLELEIEGLRSVRRSAGDG